MDLVNSYKNWWSVALATAAVGGTAAYLMKSNNKNKKSTEEPEETWESHVNEKHGDLQELVPGQLWRLEAPGCDMGPPVRNMTIYRPPNNNNGSRLVIMSAIAVREDMVEKILALGTPTVMVVPNSMHRRCAGVWKRRFPKMLVVCVGCQDSRTKIEQIVPVDLTTAELCQQPDWKDYIQVRKIDGWNYFEEILELALELQDNDNNKKKKKKKKAMVVCDLLFTLPKVEGGGIMSDLIQWIFDSNASVPQDGEMIVPKISRVGRMFGIRDWVAAEAWYRDYCLQEGPSIYCILVGHGPPIVEMDAAKGCSDALWGVAEQLLKPRW